VVAVFRDWLQSGRGLYALTEMLLFIGVLAIGLVYVWVKRDIEWVKQLPVERPDDLSKAA
jgi:NADH-quinone oxidoreductase subunit A